MSTCWVDVARPKIPSRGNVLIVIGEEAWRIKWES